MIPILAPAQIENDCKFYGLVMIVILLTAIFLMLLHKQKKIVLQRKNLDLEKQIHEKDRELKLLQREIELRNRKLSARALYLSSRNQHINNLILFIETIPELSKVPTLDMQIKQLKDYLRGDNE